MTLPSEDSRNRPVVLQTHAEPADSHLRKPVRVLAGATLVVAALSGAAGLAFGGSAVWSIVSPQGGNNAPAPLWIAPPSPVTTQEGVARVDDHRTTSDPDHPTTTKPTTKKTETEPGRGGGQGRGGGGGGTAATQQTGATHEAPAATTDAQRGKGGSGGGGSSSGSSGSGGGSSGGGGGGDDAHGGGDG